VAQVKNELQESQKQLTLKTEENGQLKASSSSSQTEVDRLKNELQESQKQNTAKADAAALQTEVGRLKNENSSLQSDLSKSSEKVICSAVFWRNVNFMFFIDNKTKIIRYWKWQQNGATTLMDLIVNGQQIKTNGTALSAVNFGNGVRVYFTDENRKIFQLCLDNSPDSPWYLGGGVGKGSANVTARATTFAALGGTDMFGAGTLLRVYFQDQSTPNNMQIAHFSQPWSSWEYIMPPGQQQWYKN